MSGKSDPPSKAQVGRPTKFNNEVLERLYSALADGMPLKGACVVTGIGVQTLADWRKRDPGIEDRLNEAYERARLKALSEIKAAGEKDWRAHKAWLELTRPGDYRTGAKIEVTANAKAVSGIVITVERQREIQERTRRLMEGTGPSVAANGEQPRKGSEAADDCT